MEDRRLAHFSIRLIAEALLAAIALVAIATLARMFLTFVFAQSLPYATFFPAILLATLYRGPVAGTAATLLALGATWNYEIASSLGYQDNVSSGSKIAFAIAGGTLVWFATLYGRKVEALERVDRERQLLLNELEHRSKNKLAVVQAILGLSMSDRDEANVISERVRAAIDTEKLLGVHKATTLERLVSAPSWAYGASRLKTRGPHVEVPAHVARALSMIFHELTTNAAKHGALSTAEGHIEIEWERAGSLITLVWLERGGPEVCSPTEHNFGTKLITKTLSLLNGSIEANFDTTGLRCTMTFRID